MAGEKGNISGSNIPGGFETGLSSGEGGDGIKNSAVQQVYDRVPEKEQSDFHGKCAEADMLSKAANKKGITSLNGLKEMVNGANMQVWRNDKKMKPMAPCSSCAHVKKQLIMNDDCKK